MDDFLKGLKYMSKGRQVILLSTVVAFLSLFMAWTDVGLVTFSGFKQEGYFYLLLFVYPFYKVLRKERYNSKIGIVLGAVAVLFTIIFLRSQVSDFFGEKVNIAGKGAYLFIIASIAFTFGNYMEYKREQKREVGIDTVIIDADKED